MKKLLIIALVSLFVGISLDAQTTEQLLRQQKQLNELLRDMADVKPLKSAKKLAKEYTKEGWKVPAGESPIEIQLTKSELLGRELMTDMYGTSIPRFVQHTSFSTAGSYNAAYGAARANAQAEIANALATQIAVALEAKLDNAQIDDMNATTVDKLHQRVRAIVNGTLTNMIPTVVIYRRLPNNNVEVQVRIAFDKNELSNRLKQNLQKELETEGDKLNEAVNNAINQMI